MVINLFRKGFQNVGLTAQLRTSSIKLACVPNSRAYSPTQAKVPVNLQKLKISGSFNLKKLKISKTWGKNEN